jgi:uncharacterized membrane protein
MGHKGFISMLRKSGVIGEYMVVARLLLCWVLWCGLVADLF